MQNWQWTTTTSEDIGSRAVMESPYSMACFVWKGVLWALALQGRFGAGSEVSIDRARMQQMARERRLVIHKCATDFQNWNKVFFFISLKNGTRRKWNTELTDSINRFPYIERPRNKLCNLVPIMITWKMMIVNYCHGVQMQWIHDFVLNLLIEWCFCLSLD